MSLDVAALRNILAVIRNIDRHELPKMSNEEWAVFREDPYRGFLVLPNDGQQRVAEIVSQRVHLPFTPHLREPGEAPCRSA